MRQEKALKKEKDAALQAAGDIYRGDRESHKAVHRVIKEASDVQQCVQLVQGAGQHLAQVARRAVAAVSPEKRPALEAELKRSSMAMSASQHALAQSDRRVSNQLATASQQVRQLNKAVHDCMPGF